jgi:hypothetical protein
MLTITCETVARNELTDDEALRVLQEAIDLPQEVARRLLDELSQSILIRTSGRISFLMRSFGEYLAALELHDKPVDRIKELAFLNNNPHASTPARHQPSTRLSRGQARDPRT